ncbi:hypothetical protein V8B97DRAFT_2087713 [Scleroderma yunnanense]
MGHSNRLDSLVHLAFCPCTRYIKRAAIPDLEEGIAFHRAALELCPSGHYHHGFILNELATNLRNRYLKLGVNGDLEKAISLHRSAMYLSFPAGHSDRSTSLFNLVLCLFGQYDKQATLPDLQEAITLGRAALELCPPGHSNRDLVLNNLAFYLWCRYRQLNVDDDLAEAISLHRFALKLRPAGHFRRSWSLSSLALCLSDRYIKQSTLSDLQGAITLGRVALQLHPMNHPDRDLTLNNLANDLWHRYRKLDENRDLDEAILLHQSALGLCPAGHPERLASLTNLTYCLSSRFEKQGAAVDLDELIALHRAILELPPPGHPDHTTSQQSSTILQHCKFGHPDHITFILGLTSDHHSKFQQVGAISDLEGVISLSRTVLELHPHSDTAHARYLDIVVLCIKEILDKLGRVRDYDEAVDLARQALELHPSGDPDHESSLSILASFLSARFQEHIDLADLEEIVMLRRMILALCPEGHSRHPSSLHDLALCLSDHFDELADPADIVEAISLGSSALELCPQGHPDWAMLRTCLASYHEKMDKESTPRPVQDDGRQSIMATVYNILEFYPPRLLNTHTGTPCDRDALISAFENSQECKQLLSSSKARLFNLDDDIRTTVSKYFEYVTLSHRWGKDEPLLRQIQGKDIFKIDRPLGLQKLQSFCATARNHGYLWAWCDTCCIDKDSTVELATAIASMFSWYRRSALTIVYLSDVFRFGQLSNSAWFTRGWTLQELLAPRNVLFYTQRWSLYKPSASSNHKDDDIVLDELERATGITSHYLTEFSPGLDNARSRLQWASGRYTTVPEDIAYSLLGIFNIFLPIIPGESAENALGRLLAEIISKSGDISVLDWVGEASSFNSCFPAYIASYQTNPHPPCSYHGCEVQSPASVSQELAEAHMELFDTLSALDRLQYISGRLRLPCIVYQVTGVQLGLAHSRTRKYVYEIEAEGIAPLELTLASQLTDTSCSDLLLIRPWHSKLLPPFTGDNGAAADALATMLGQPFRAFLLEEQSRKEYKRIAPSSPIIAYPADATGIILQSQVQTLNVV